MTSLRLLAGTFLLLLASGCATILAPKLQPVILHTDPEGAGIFDENDRQVGVTPYDISRLSPARKTLRLTKEGYQSEEVRIRRKNNNGYYFLDAMLLCIPCPVDLSRGALASVIPLDGPVKLHKIRTEEDKEFRLAVDQVSYGFSEIKPLGKLNKTPKKLDDKGFARMFAYKEDLSNQVMTVLQKSYIEPASMYEMEEEGGALNKPRIIVRPTIEKISFDFKGKTLREFTGPCSIDCSWKFFMPSDLNFPAAEITLNTTAFRQPGNNDLIADHLMQEATRDLLDVDTLRSFLQRLESEYLYETKGTAIRIKAPALPTHASTKAALKASIPGVLTVMHKGGFGSGVIISRDGYVVTNYHVVEKEKIVTVRLNADLKLKATVVKTNTVFDLALLKIDADDLHALRFGDSNTSEIGDDVYAIGTPMETSLNQSISKGIISGFREFNGIKFIQTDVSINSGNSGGPLINDKGEVVGIATMKFSGKGVEGLGFGIPSNLVIEMLNLQLD